MTKEKAGLVPDTVGGLPSSGCLVWERVGSVLIPTVGTCKLITVYTLYDIIVTMSLWMILHVSYEYDNISRYHNDIMKQLYCHPAYDIL